MSVIFKNNSIFNAMIVVMASCDRQSLSEHLLINPKNTNKTNGYCDSLSEGVREFLSKSVKNVYTDGYRF